MKKYIVRQGDTMWSISKATGVRLNLLMAANPQIQDPNQLQPGMVVAIPELTKTKLPGKPVSVPKQPQKTQVPKGATSTGVGPTPSYFGFVWPHEVKQGESWETIATQYNLSVAQLADMNPIQEGQPLKPGDVVFVPAPYSGEGMPQHGAPYGPMPQPGMQPGMQPPYPGTHGHGAPYWSAPPHGMPPTYPATHGHGMPYGPMPQHGMPPYYPGSGMPYGPTPQQGMEPYYPPAQGPMGTYPPTPQQGGYPPQTYPYSGMLPPQEQHGPHTHMPFRYRHAKGHQGYAGNPFTSYGLADPFWQSGQETLDETSGHAWPEDDWRNALSYPVDGFDQQDDPSTTQEQHPKAGDDDERTNLE